MINKNIKIIILNKSTTNKKIDIQIKIDLVNSVKIAKEMVHTKTSGITRKKNLFMFVKL